VCSDTAIERTIDPAIADLQHEYDDATHRGLMWRRRSVRFAGYLAIWQVIVASIAGALSRGIHEWTDADERAMGRTIGFSSVAMMVVAALILWPSLSHFPYHVPSDTVARMMLYLVPQTLPIATPVGLMFGILLGLRGRPVNRRIRWSVTILVIFCSVVMFVVVAWTVPAANQAFRQLAAGRPVLRGLNELTLRDLASADPRQVRWLVTTKSTDEFAFAFHFRLALAFAPLVVGLFALGITAARRTEYGRVTLGVAALTSSLAYYALLYGAQAEFNAGRLRPGVAGWTPNFVFFLVTLLLFRLSPSAATPEALR
jgi:hypothetical protein